jgi:transcription initiation factor TFIIB
MSYKLASEPAEACSLCSSTSIVFDSETSEAICSSCGMVVKDNIESMGPEWRSYSGEDMESKSRTGMPSSLAFHDMGLSTFISYSNVDANGVAITD